MYINNEKIINRFRTMNFNLTESQVHLSNQHSKQKWLPSMETLIIACVVLFPSRDEYNTGP